MVISKKKIFVAKRGIKAIFRETEWLYEIRNKLTIELCCYSYERMYSESYVDEEITTVLKEITEYFIEANDIESAKCFLDGLDTDNLFKYIFPIIRKAIKSKGHEDDYLKIPNFVCKILNELGILEDWIEEKYSTDYNKANNKDVPKNVQQIKGLTKVQYERMEKYFKIAIDEGLIIESGNSYTWNDSKAKLAYFIHEVFNYDGVQRIPYKMIQELFNVKRLDSAVDKAINPKESQKWRKNIDEIFKTEN